MNGTLHLKKNGIDKWAIQVVLLLRNSLVKQRYFALQKITLKKQLHEWGKGLGVESFGIAITK